MSLCAPKPLAVNKKSGSCHHKIRCSAQSYEVSSFTNMDGNSYWFPQIENVILVKVIYNDSFLISTGLLKPLAKWKMGWKSGEPMLRRPKDFHLKKKLSGSVW